MTTPPTASGRRVSVPSSWRARRLACIGFDVALSGVAINLALLVITLLVRPDLDPLQNTLSYYAVGPWGALQSAGFTAMGIASIALGLALPQARLRRDWARPCALFLAVSGVAALGLAIFPLGRVTPHTIIGDLHQTSGTIGGVLQLIAALALWLAIRRTPAFHWLARLALAVVIVAVGGAILTQIAIWHPDLGIPLGATMRLVVLPLTILWGAVALRLRQGCRMPGSSAP